MADRQKSSMSNGIKRGLALIMVMAFSKDLSAEEAPRPLSTDRPSNSSSPYTVNTGRHILEADIVKYSKRPSGESYSFANTTLRSGLTPSTESQFSLPLFNIQRADGTEKHGLGDLQLRIKTNLLGNDHGDIALALAPWIKIPTNQDDSGNGYIEGGLILPVAMRLPANWSLGATWQWNLMKDDAGKVFSEWVSVLNIGRSFAGNLSGYAELFGSQGTADGSRFKATVDFGITYTINENTQCDAGVNLGVTDAADEVNPFVGMAVSF